MQLLDSRDHQTGFSLIELLVTLAILTTLLTVALPAYQDFTVKTKYGASVNTLGANKNALIHTAIQNGFSFSNIPEDELDEQEMYEHFALEDTSNGKYLGRIGGKKESDHDYMLYQFVDKEAMNAPDIAPQMVAMAVVIAESGAFSYHCHYYHSDYAWDYSGGERFVSLDCNDSTRHSIADVGEDTSGVSSSSGDSSSGDSSSGDSSSGGNLASGADGGSPEDSGEMCDHGGKVKSNNGHGNNVDGVDSSNPGKGNNKKNDESCSGSTCIDDEKNKGGKR